MARMTKTQAEQQAKNEVDSLNSIRDTGLDTLDAMTWEQRRNGALSLAQQNMSSLIVMAEPKVREAWTNAFVDRTLSIWGGKLKKREQQRNEWRTITRTQSMEQLVLKIADYVRSCNVRGAVVDHGYGSASVRIKRAGNEVDLDFRFERQYDEGIGNPDDAKQRGGYYTFVGTRINWSGSTRSLSHATACLALYREAVELAAEIEAAFTEERAAWTFGVPEATEQPSEPSDAQLTDVAS